MKKKPIRYAAAITLAIGFTGYIIVTDVEPLDALGLDAPDLSAYPFTSSGMSMLVNGIAGYANVSEMIILPNGTQLTAAPNRSQARSMASSSVSNCSTWSWATGSVECADRTIRPVVKETAYGMVSSNRFP